MTKNKQTNKQKPSDGYVEKVNSCSHLGLVGWFSIRSIGGTGSRTVEIREPKRYMTSGEVSSVDKTSEFGRSLHRN
jgi:hypothetical protein